MNWYEYLILPFNDINGHTIRQSSVLPYFRKRLVFNKKGELSLTLLKILFSVPTLEKIRSKVLSLAHNTDRVAFQLAMGFA